MTYAPTAGQQMSRLLFSLPLRRMYSRADCYFINSFFPCSPIDSAVTEVFPRY